MSLVDIETSSDSHKTCLVYLPHCGMLLTYGELGPFAVSPGQGMNHPSKIKFVLQQIQNIFPMRCLIVQAKSCWVTRLTLLNVIFVSFNSSLKQKHRGRLTYDYLRTVNTWDISKNLPCQPFLFKDNKGSQEWKESIT